MASQTNIQWELHPRAESFVLDQITTIIESLPEAHTYCQRLTTMTSTELLDWVDYVKVSGRDIRRHLMNVGYSPYDALVPNGTGAYRHPGAQLPAVLTSDTTSGPDIVALKCESVADVLNAAGLHRDIAGAPLSPFREAALFSTVASELRVTERCGFNGYTHIDPDESYAVRRLAAREIWATRQRSGDDTEAISAARLAAGRIVDLAGVDAAACLAMSVERDYWQRRNHAGQVQRARQDEFGFGWANHDHHTFRSSRRYFRELVLVLETLGFQCRERFYAGADAGWGAQVLEQPNCGVVVFADVDLMPDELDFDFAHEPLRDTTTLGTVGLWCALHGESLGSAGLHHLEGQFDFESLRRDLSERGVEMLAPFSDYDYLRQAFTKGERWAVDASRVERLVSSGLLSEERAARFLEKGAIGSHLEGLQRHHGYRGFNTAGVSRAIRSTDPRLN